MMKRYISAAGLFLLLIMLFSLCGCSDNADQSAEGVLTEVKDGSGNITGYERRYHNDNGDITRLDVYDADEVYEYFVLYEYDDSNRLIQETRYRADGIGEYYYTYEYDDDGNITEKGYFSATDGAELTLYDAEGNETERYIYDNTDTLTKHEVLENGQWVEASEEAADETE